MACARSPSPGRDAVSRSLPFSRFSRNLRQMPIADKPRRTALLSFWFLGTAIIGSLVIALVAEFAPAPAHLAVLGAFISILGGLFLSYLGQEDDHEQKRTEVIQSLAVPLTLDSDLILAGRTEFRIRESRLPAIIQIAILRSSRMTESGQRG